MKAKSFSAQYSNVQFRPENLRRYISLYKKKPYDQSLYFIMLRLLRFIMAQAEGDLKIISRYGNKENRERNLIATADVIRMAHRAEMDLLESYKKRIA